MAEDVEVLFEVGVTVGEAGPDLEVFEIIECRLAQAVGKAVGGGVAFGGVDAPASGIHPF